MSQSKLLASLTRHDFIMLLVARQATIEDQQSRIQDLEHQLEECKASKDNAETKKPKEGE